RSGDEQAPERSDVVDEVVGAGGGQRDAIGVSPADGRDGDAGGPRRGDVDQAVADGERALPRARERGADALDARAIGLLRKALLFADDGPESVGEAEDREDLARHRDRLVGRDGERDALLVELVDQRADAGVERGADDQVRGVVDAEAGGDAWR